MDSRFLKPIHKSNFMDKFYNSDFWAGGVTAFGSLVASFVVPVWPFILFLFFAVLIDLYLGIKAARIKKEKINSFGIRRTVEKLLVYSLTILLLHGMTVVFIPSVNFAYFGAFAIAMTEVQSVVENTEVITGVNIYSYIKHRLKIPDNDPDSKK